MSLIVRLLVLALMLGGIHGAQCSAQVLDQQLLQERAFDLAQNAVEKGDAKRGAILFHQTHVGCVKCHAVDGSSNSLGPDLTKLAEQRQIDAQYLVESILNPSAKIRDGFQTISVLTKDGQTITGLLAEKSEDRVVLRDPAKLGERIEFAADDIEESLLRKDSIMPQGVVNQLANRQQFLDLLKYVIELKAGGLNRARELQPPPGMIPLSIPEYESHVDHRGLIRSFDRDTFQSGEKIYNRLCVNCHGDLNGPGSLPTALRFGEGKFRNGSDPYAMYRTLTHGFGLMIPQTWMVPRQKYAVVHYIRESYLKEHNPTQLKKIDEDYLKSLPDGDTFGPEPVEYAPWSDMNYGPSLTNTYEIGSDGSNFAYKGIAVRLDSGPGGVAKGNQWGVFDHDTLRVAAVWRRADESQENGFIDWQGIHFDGRHGVHPRIVGDIDFQNPTGPGWANPETGKFDDDLRVIGRDGRRYGPLPRQWAQYQGMYTIGEKTVVAYKVDGKDVLESFGTLPIPAGEMAKSSLFIRQIQLNALDRPQTALIATHDDEKPVFSQTSKRSVLLSADENAPRSVSASRFDGNTYLEIKDADALNMTTGDFTISAKIKTSTGGTIFSKTKPTGPWVPNGKTFFVRGGRLCYDIGWVGVVQSKKRVDDGKWHDVAMTWDQTKQLVRFYVDGKHSGGGRLAPKEKVRGDVARIGLTSENFPKPSHFQGEMKSVTFWNRALTEDQLTSSSAEIRPVAGWDLSALGQDDLIENRFGNGQIAHLERGSNSAKKQTAILSGVVGDCDQCEFRVVGNKLCLTFLPGRKSRNIIVWTATVDSELPKQSLQRIISQVEDRIQVLPLGDLLKQSAPQRWPEVLTTTPRLAGETEAFAVDDLSPPFSNPWFCRIRLTGHDFFANGDELAVCSWDGDVWHVKGLKTLSATSEPKLIWRRIASGLFQPLGLKIVDGEIYVTCRDQLVILKDRNNDGETDFYECFNNDHQVTDHFHEFAMGLQRDDEGNLYYAKSARHALTALVPHHGTLLRISPDGETTTILATGFRAANGVCLNPDGSFIVTDQEGHWNPKNRINWVTEGGFYGNMFGYHDVTDSADSAMEQPLCWITNAFDRSPSELLWVESPTWGNLQGQLLNLSYGYGKVYVVPHEKVKGQMQGGMCQLPIPQFPTGTCRGRFHPGDGGLYLSGMFAWGSNQQTQEGGLYRLRRTNLPSYLPVGLTVLENKIRITWSDPIHDVSAENVDQYQIKTWDLVRSARYGSDHHNEKRLKVTRVSLSADRRMMDLEIPEIAPTWGMEIVCRFRAEDGQQIERILHNTIHHLGTE